MEDRPSRLAFCKILFGRNGGTFTSKGLPIFGVDDARGNCDRGWDCGECNIMHEWLGELATQGWEWGWECDKCLRDSMEADGLEGGSRLAQGFYQSGRAEFDPYDLRYPAITGCTNCGWESSFLQLVLKKAK